MKERKRLGYLDGLKAVAAVLVFNIHFLNAYYCGIYTLDPQDFHTESGLEWWFGATPLNMVYAGKVGARIFLAVSAFLLAYGFLSTHNKRKLLVSPIKKYIRLAPGVLLVNTGVYFLMRAGAYYNAQAAALAGSEEFFGVYNRFTPKLLDAVGEALAGCFLYGSNRYNGPLWFMQYELLGCALIALILYAAGSWKPQWRLCVYGAAALVCIRTDYLCMILSAAAAELVRLGESGAKGRGTQASGPEQAGEKEGRNVLTSLPVRGVCWLSRQKWLLWGMTAVCLYFLTYPSMGRTEGTIYALLPPKVMFYYNGAIPVLLFCLLHLKPLQRLLDRKVLRSFHQIAYFFYLVHFPLLATLSAFFFTALYGMLPYPVLTAFTYLLAFAASVLAAWLLTVLVDRPVQKLAARLEEKLLCRK